MLSLLMVLTSFSMAQTYTMVSSESGLEDGAQYLLVGFDDNDNAYAMGYQRSNNRLAVVVTEDGGAITATIAADANSQTEAFEFILGGSTDAWTLFDALNGGYLYAPGGGNYMRTKAEGADDTTWAIAFDDNGGALPVCNAAVEQCYMHFNLNASAGTPLFSCYKSTSSITAPVYFFKRNDGVPFVAAPTFSPANGTEFGDEGLEVTISQANGKPIYYTLDGTNPSNTSTQYTGAISLTATTTIKAIAYDGTNASNIATATYTYVDLNGPGTENNPYTVAQARAAIDANAGVNGVYATGIVSAIPTAYNQTYGNVTFNMVDAEGDEVFLQAYRCGGALAEEVAIGDVAVVYGNLKNYNGTYEFNQGCTLVSLTHPSTFVAIPTFSPEEGTFTEAQTVTISCATEGASIYYTLNGNDPTNASTLYNGPISIEETTTIKAIAYDGNNVSEIATATYTIITTANNISDITATGNYVVQGTIVARSTKGFIVGDGTGYVYYYNTNYDQNTYAIGDMVKLSGSVTTYGGVFEFNNSAEVTPATSSNYVEEDPTEISGAEMDARVASTANTLSNYVQYQGTLSVSGSHYNITNIDGATTAQGSISYPLDTEFTALNGKTVKVSGYFVGVSSSTYFNTMLGSIEEVTITEPTITITPNVVNLAATGEGISQMETLNIAYTNIVAEDYQSFTVEFCDAEGATQEQPQWLVVGVTAVVDAEDEIVEGEFQVRCVVPNNTGEARTAYFKLYAYDAGNNKVYSNIVTVNQEAYVAPTVASLPFEFTGGLADIENTDGLTQNGLGNYNSDPKLKFDGTGDWLMLLFDETPGKLSFDIKGNAFSEGTFTVETSANGQTWATLATYTELGTTQHEAFNNLNEDVRYIRWIYTEKVNGNVALGNITLAKYSTDPVITVDKDAFTFTYEEGGSADAQSFNVGGDHLLEGIVIELPEGSNFGISSNGIDWDNNTLTIDATTEIFVRLNPGLDAGTYEDAITISSEGADNVVVALTGTVTAAIVIPVITAYDITLPYYATSGKINYSISNGDATTDITVTTDPSCEWITEISVYPTYVSIITTINESEEARSTIITFSYPDAENKTVTVTQEPFAYAELPFSFDGGKADISTTDGLNQSGLDSDYGNSPKLKFNTTGDYVLLNFVERPGTLTFDIKGNSFSNGTFSVETSADGESWATLKTYTELPAMLSETFANLDEDIRYIRWIYTNKGNGNVALGNIVLNEFVAPQPHELTIGNPEHITITASYDDATLTNEESAEVLDGTTVTLTLTFEEGYVLDSLTVTEADGSEVNVTELADADDTWTFIMPTSDVIVNAVAKAAPFYVNYSPATSIESGRHYIIVGLNGTTAYAMGQQTNNNRAAIEISLQGTTAAVDTAAGIQEVIINGPDADGNYTLYDAAMPGYLYASSSSSNQLRTETFVEGNGKWAITFGDTTKIIAQGENTRNMMQFNSSNNIFACYGSTTQKPVFLYVRDNETDYEFVTDIAGYGEDNNHWQLISSPLAEVDPQTFELGEEHDLYAFDPAGNGEELEWRNFKAEAFTLQAGKGYLYASASTITLHFVGQPNTNGTVALTYANTGVEAHNGWNLVGNPFGCAATLDRPFYVLNEDGTAIVPSESNVVNSMQAVFVIAGSAGETVTFTPVNE